MKKWISLLVCVLLLTACGSSFQTIDSNKAMELIDAGATVIDVRSSEEYNQQHIKDAVNIPVDTITEETIAYDKDTTILVYCASGVRSAEAAKTLIDLGYTNVYNLDGGLINWGFDLVSVTD